MRKAFLETPDESFSSAKRISTRDLAILALRPCFGASVKRRMSLEVPSG